METTRIVLTEELFFEISKYQNFFQSMNAIRVLRLCHSGISSLPNSIFQLNKLFALNLSNCRQLSELNPLIGELKNLRELDLSLTRIQNLPKEIGELINLQKLGLRRVELRTVQVEISNLCSLEELNMFQSFSKWSTDSKTDSSSDQSGEEKETETETETTCCASLNQVVQITSLTSLQIMVEKLESITDVIIRRIENLQKFCLIIGPRIRTWQLDDFSYENYSKSLVFLHCKTSSLDGFGVLRDLECLIISACQNLSSVSVLIGVQKRLRDLRIENCNELREITGPKNETPLRNLEKLSLVHLPLVEGELELGKNLKNAQITGCPGLKNLQTCLSKIEGLEELYMGNCEEIEALEDNKLTKLEKLHIYCLPRLTSIGVLRNLKVLYVWRCPQLKNFPSGFCGFESLEELHICDVCEVETIVAEVVGERTILPRLMSLHLMRLESLKSIWEAKLGLGTFENLRELRVSNCPKLKTILSFGFGQLESLKEVHIDQCEGLESIIEDGAIEENRVGLKSLERLHITNAPKLTGVFAEKSGAKALENMEVPYLSHCSALKVVIPCNSRGLEKLRHIYVGDCHSIEQVIGGEGVLENAVPSLERILIVNLPRLKAVWEGELGDGSLKSLKFLQVNKCPELTNLLSHGSHKLETLEIIRFEDCDSFKSIMGKNPTERFAVPGLKLLDLINLTRMHIIWQEGLGNGAFGGLERLTVGNCPELEALWDGEIGDGALRSLKNLGVFKCPKLRILLPSSLQRLKKLEQVSIDDSGAEIIARWVEEENALPSLKTSELHNLPRLENIWEGEPARGALRELKKLSVKGCPLLEKLPTGLNKCRNLESLVVQDCIKLAKIVVETEEIVMPNLVHLYLQCLPRLESISEKTMGVGVLERLEMLEVKGLKGLKCFPSELQKLCKLRQLYVKECEEMEVLIDGMWEKNALANLQYLDIEYLPKLKMIWEGVPGTRCLENLKGFYVKGCQAMKNFPYGLTKLERLEILHVKNCAGMDVIFREDGIEVSILSSLIELRVEELPSLRRIWEGTVELPNVRYLTIIDCPRLMDLPIGLDILSLKRITASKDWWGGLEFEGDLKSKLEKFYRPWPMEEFEIKGRRRFRGIHF